MGDITETVRAHGGQAAWDPRHGNSSVDGIAVFEKG